MPAIKVKPSRYAQKRDFWGDKDEGAKLQTLIGQVYGTHFGVIKEALAALQLNRRLYNMYLTGERSIPDDLWSRLKAIKKHKATTAATLKARKILAFDDVDPLS